MPSLDRREPVTLDATGTPAAVVYCLVDAAGALHLEDGASSYADVARAHGLNEEACDRYRFDLVARRVLPDRPGPAAGLAVRAYVAREFGTPEKLMAAGRAGRLTKQVMANLLSAGDRSRYLDACASIERRYTEACTATGDPCLEAGCAVEGEICLQPLKVAGAEYFQACAAEWITLFANPGRRIDSWKA